MRTLDRIATVVLFTSALELALVACGGDEEPPPPSTPPPAPVAQATPPQAPAPPPSQPAPAKNNQGIQIPGLGNIPLPVPNKQGTQPQAPATPGQPNGQGGNGPGGDGQGSGNGQLQIPGLPGVSIPNVLQGGDGQGGSSAGGNARREPPARGTLPPATPGSYDALGHLTPGFLRSRAVEIHRQLVAALTGAEANSARPIPFRVVEETQEPNAAAGCTKRSNSPVMLITSAMLVLAAGISETKSYDEVANTNTLDTYINEVIQQVRTKQPVGPVPGNLVGGPMALDSHRLSRQQHLYDQQVAFIIGHELAHHYRGHTSCVGGRTAEQVQVDDMARILAKTVPLFSQPREVEADMWGIVNVLEAGRNLGAGAWNEEGALLNLDFFARLRQRGGAQLAMLFLSTHPDPLLRRPIVTATARQWRPGWRPMTTPGEGSSSGGGLRLPTPGGGNVQLPLPIPLPGSP